MQQAKPRRSYLSLIIIVGTITILVLTLLVVIGIFVIARQANSTSTAQLNPFVSASPLNELDIDNIDPALALTSLGGKQESNVILDAIDKARPETALAGLLFQPTLTNRESAGGFLLLANEYWHQGDIDKSILSYRLACLVATLGPDIPDTVRADLFIQAGEGLIDINSPELAKFCLDQAFIVAAKSPFLQAAHRRSIFERLQNNYIILEERVLARQSLALGANPPPLTEVVEQQTILPPIEPVLLSAEIQEAETHRWQAAQELAALLVERGGSMPETAVANLAETLVAEDRLKLPYYDAEIENTTQLSKRVDFVFAKIAWLSIKYRVARKGYGLSLVPAWEENVEVIRADLTKTYENLYTLYADLIVALPEVSQIDKATEERLRSEVLAGELGRYPNYPEEQRRKQLLEASNQLKTTQPELGTFMGIDTVNNENMFSLVSLGDNNAE